MRKRLVLGLAAGAALLLGGCASTAAEEPATDAPAAQEEQPQDAQKSDTAQPGEFSFAEITSCDQVQPYVATWTGGMVVSDITSVSATEVHCAWMTPPETPVEDARSVEVLFKQAPERPDYSVLAEMTGYESLSDAWVAEQGGEAFALTIDIGLSAIIGTTVWVPGVELSISGGKWAGLPDLDATAGLEIAQQILSS